MTLREQFRERCLAGNDAEGTEALSLYSLDQVWFLSAVM